MGAAEVGSRGDFGFLGGGGVGGGGVPGGGVAGEFAVHEDEAEGVVLRGAGGGDVTTVAAVDFAIGEPGGRGAVDEIYASGDGAVVEIVAAVVYHEGVLPAEDSALGEELAVAVDTVECEGLAVVAGRVFDGEVGEAGVVSGDEQAGVEAVAAGRMGVVDVAVPGEGGGGGVVAEEGDVGFVFGDEEGALVGAGMEVDFGAVGGVGGDGGEGFLEGFEVGGAVGGDGEDFVGGEAGGGEGGGEEEEGEKTHDDSIHNG